MDLDHVNFKLMRFLFQYNHDLKTGCKPLVKLLFIRFQHDVAVLLFVLITVAFLLESTICIYSDIRILGVTYFFVFGNGASISKSIH